jgi:hypothetical protein
MFRTDSLVWMTPEAALHKRSAYTFLERLGTSCHSASVVRSNLLPHSGQVVRGVREKAWMFLLVSTLRGLLCALHLGQVTFNVVFMAIPFDRILP